MVVPAATSGTDSSSHSAGSKAVLTGEKGIQWIAWRVRISGSNQLCVEALPAKRMAATLALLTPLLVLPVICNQGRNRGRGGARGKNSTSMSLLQCCCDPSHTCARCAAPYNALPNSDRPVSGTMCAATHLPVEVIPCVCLCILPGGCHLTRQQQLAPALQHRIPCGLPKQDDAQVGVGGLAAAFLVLPILKRQRQRRTGRSQQGRVTAFLIGRSKITPWSPGDTRRCPSLQAPQLDRLSTLCACRLLFDPVKKIVTSPTCTGLKRLSPSPLIMEHL